MYTDHYFYKEPGSPTGSEASKTSKDVGASLKDFIYLYQMCPALWNPNDENYLNKQKRIKDIDKLVEVYEKIKPNANRGDVKKKINSLRSNYRKELKKIEQSKLTATRTEDIYKPTSVTFYRLKFLDQVERGPSMGEAEEDEQETHEEHQDTLLIPSVTESPPPTLLIPSITITNDSPPPKKRRKNPETLQCELLSRTCDLLTQISVPNNNVDPVALVWTEKLSRLEPMQRCHAEKAINDILYEAQLNNLSRGSVQINANSSPRPYVLHVKEEPES